MQNLGSLPFVPDTNIELDPANSTFMYDGNHDDPSGQYHTLNVPSMPNDQYHQQQPPTMMTTAPVSVSHYQQQPPAEYSSWMNAASRGVHHHEQPGVMSFTQSNFIPHMTPDVLNSHPPHMLDSHHHALMAAPPNITIGFPPSAAHLHPGASPLPLAAAASTRKTTGKQKQAGNKPQKPKGTPGRKVKVLDYEVCS